MRVYDSIIFFCFIPHKSSYAQSGKFTLERVRSHCWGVPGVAERVEAPLLSAGLLLATAVAAVAANDMAAGVNSGAAAQLSSLLFRAFDPAAAGALVLAAAAASGSRVL